ncbi:ankyrin repeat domain-containing protein [Sulfurimonas sp. HSL-1716]|uniref:ankyrin repeat domain-containing protein n=1 Tax=Hydrocurvibacter sulfurireducens TaxID=3131937 RepID=UPI0031F98777
MNKWIRLLQDNDYLGIKKYIKEGADVNESNDTEESVLACALKYRCDDEIVDILVQNGADLRDFNEDGVSILEYAIMYNKIDLIKKIIESGVNVNHTNRPSRFTPLMGAVSYGRGEIVKLLLENNADKYAKDVKGLSALDFAKKTHKKSMIKLLEEA